MGYRQGQGDHTLVTKHPQEKVSSLLSSLVDGTITTWDDVVEKERLQKQLAQEFVIKDLKKFKYFCGIKVAYSKQEIFVSLTKYALDPKEIGKLSKVSSILIDEGNKK